MFTISFNNISETLIQENLGVFFFFCSYASLTSYRQSTEINNILTKIHFFYNKNIHTHTYTPSTRRVYRKTVFTGLNDYFILAQPATPSLRPATGEINANRVVSTLDTLYFFPFLSPSLPFFLSRHAQTRKFASQQHRRRRRRRRVCCRRSLVDSKTRRRNNGVYYQSVYINRI